MNVALFLNHASCSIPGFKKGGAVCIIIIALLGALVASAQKPTVTKGDGVRLVGDTVVGRGRLEISTMFKTYPNAEFQAKERDWVPVCSEFLYDTTPQMICELLGYKYGRSYFSNAIAFTSKSRYNVSAAGLRCFPFLRNARNGRQLRSTVAAAIATASSDTSIASEGMSLQGVERGQLGRIAQGAHRQHARRDRSLAYETLYTAFPRKAPYACSFTWGSCEPNGPFAGIECSNVAYPPQPPTPPPPPPYAEMIRLIGGAGRPGATPEANLCASMPAGFCSYGRVELQVNAPGGGSSGNKIWAPLCGIKNDAMRARVAKIACEQKQGWPSVQLNPGVIIRSQLPPSPPYSFSVPTAGVPAGDANSFNPAAYKGWVSITSVEDVQPISLQEGNLTVTTVPCNDLFAVLCDETYAR